MAHPPAARDRVDPHRTTRWALWAALVVMVVGATGAKVAADWRYTAALHTRMRRLQAARLAFLQLTRDADDLLARHADAPSVRATLGIDQPFRFERKKSPTPKSQKPKAGPEAKRSQGSPGPRSPPPVGRGLPRSVTYHDRASGVSIRLDFDARGRLTHLGYAGQIGPPGGLPARWGWETASYRIRNWMGASVGTRSFSLPLFFLAWIALAAWAGAAVARDRRPRRWAVLALWAWSAGWAVLLLIAVPYTIHVSALWNPGRMGWAWLMVGGAAAITAAHLMHPTRSDPLACPSCGYSLRGNVTGKCPECGKPIPDHVREHLRTTEA